MSEPAVWDAIICISALFESPYPCLDQTASRTGTYSIEASHHTALSCYSRSLSAVRSQIESGLIDSFVGLVTCTLFICIEALQGSEKTATQLYGQGVHLIRALRAQINAQTVSAAKAALLEDTIVPLFLRLGSIALTVSGIPEIPPLLCEGGTRDSMLVSLKAARDAMVLLSAEVRSLQMNCDEHIQQSPGPVPKALIARQVALLTRLGNWHDAFTVLRTTLPPNPAIPAERSIVSLLSTYADMHHIILCTCTAPTESSTDAFLAQFKSIVTHAGFYLQNRRHAPTVHNLHTHSS